MFSPFSQSQLRDLTRHYFTSQFGCLALAASQSSAAVRGTPRVTRRAIKESTVLCLVEMNLRLKQHLEDGMLSKSEGWELAYERTNCLFIAW